MFIMRMLMMIVGEKNRHCYEGLSGLLIGYDFIALGDKGRTDDHG